MLVLTYKLITIIQYNIKYYNIMSYFSQISSAYHLTLLHMCYSNIDKR